ncbi:hypothetical protein Tco_0545357 [Tanacetum coccineum]
MRTKDRITKYSTQQPIPTSTNDSNINPTPYTSVTNRNISPISWEFSGNNNGPRNRWMRYEDGGESLENVVESGGGDGGLKGCLVPWFVKPRSPKRPILSVLDEGDLFV